MYIWIWCQSMNKLYIWVVVVYIDALKNYENHGFVNSMVVYAILQVAYNSVYSFASSWEAGYHRYNK